MTAGMSAQPATWILDTPDLTTAGYDPARALKTGQSAAWEVDEAGGDVLPFIGSNPTNNAQITIAGARQATPRSPCRGCGCCVDRVGRKRN
jgi:hypothetical protein